MCVTVNNVQKMLHILVDTYIIYVKMAMSHVFNIEISNTYNLIVENNPKLTLLYVSAVPLHLTYSHIDIMHVLTHYATYIQLWNMHIYLCVIINDIDMTFSLNYSIQRDTILNYFVIAQ